MAKRGGRKGSKGGRKGGKGAKGRSAKGGRKSSMSPAQRKKVVAARVRMHQAAALLKDFHGGKLPIKSGCGRPRQK